MLNTKIHYTHCQYCKKEILQWASLCAHEKYCSFNPNKKERAKHRNRKPTGKHSWNYGLTKFTDNRIQKSSIIISNILKARHKSGIASTLEKEKLRIQHIKETAQKKHSIGGKRHGSGRGKKGGIKDIGVIHHGN